MQISSQAPVFVIPARGPRARTAKLMLETAAALIQLGKIPSVSEVAEQAGVSRATAYRYFPTQASLVHAVVGRELGSMLDWSSTSNDAEARIEKLLKVGLPRLMGSQAVFRAALRHSLDQKSDTENGEPTFKRGYRVELLRKALSPLEGKMPRQNLDRLTKALSLIFGIESLIIMTDIWDADEQEVADLATWMAGALLRASFDDEMVDKTGLTKNGRSR